MNARDNITQSVDAQDPTDYPETQADAIIAALRADPEALADLCGEQTADLESRLAACLPVIAAAGEVCGHVDLHLEEGGSLNPFIHASTDDLAAALALYDETPPHGG
jgi:hypothetical protein